VGGRRRDLVTEKKAGGELYCMHSIFHFRASDIATFRDSHILMYLDIAGKLDMHLFSK